MSIHDINVQEDNDSPTLDYTFSDDSSPEAVEAPKKPKKFIKPTENFATITLQKPPRPTRSYANSEINSPDSIPNESPHGDVNVEGKNFLGAIPYSKTGKKLRCSSLGERKEENKVLRYEVRGKVIDIELKAWDDPIKVAHCFSVKNQLKGKERNNIALMLTKLQKRQR